MALILAMANAGFLVWNWPPAKIFLGDVGSGYLGYVIAVLALSAAREDPVALPVWLILGAAFFVDATVTLVRRAVRGERLHQAHRSHGYQWLARRWSSHRRVTVAFLLVNVGWLFPIAWFVSRHTELALHGVVLAIVPLVILALQAGAGRPEPENA